MIVQATHMLAVDTGVPRLLPLKGIFTAATPCDTIKNPVSNFGGSLQTEPLPMKPVKEFKAKMNFNREFLFIRKDERANWQRRQSTS